MAKRKELIKKNQKFDKKKLKDYLLKNNREKDWTIIQGEVYGKEIMKAKLYSGFNKALRFLLKKGTKVYIVSHKTKYPYQGKKINLRNAASAWIKKNIIEKNKDLNFSLRNVYFENNIKKKINRIKILKCNVFVDDLLTILDLLPNEIDKFLFNPNLNEIKNRKYESIKSWSKIKTLLEKYG